MDIEEIVNDINLKEALAIAAGLVVGRRVPSLISKVTTDPKLQRVGQVAVGLGGSYLANYLAKQSFATGKSGLLLSYAGLAASAVAAQPIADTVDEAISQINVGGVRVIRKQPVRVERGTESSDTGVNLRKGISIGR